MYVILYISNGSGGIILLSLGDFYLRLINYRKNITETEFVRKHYGFHDVTILLSGKMILETKQQTFIINPGDAIYIPPNDYNKRTFKGDISYFSINFVLKENNNDFSLPTHMVSILSHEISSYINMVKSMLRNEQQGTEYNEKLYLFSRLILLSIIEMKIENITPSVEKAKQFIANNYQNKLTLEDISSHVHLHPSYLGTLFKKEVGSTVIEYLTKIRLEHAKKHLLNSTASIDDIGKLCGIPDSRYFCRVFKKVENVSPHHWRKLNAKNRRTQYIDINATKNINNT